MVGIRKNALTTDQCAEIVSAAHLVGFRTSAVRNSTTGESYYNEEYRESSVSFIKSSNLLDSTWNAINTTVLSLNAEHYNARLTEFDYQVAWYQSGQIGFEWHRDDPPYPTETEIWSGRKLTYVFELSSPADYEGGYLAVDPSGNYTYKPNKKSEAQSTGSGHVIGMIPGQEVLYILNEGETQVQTLKIAPTTDQFPRFRRDQGECVVFPSFFNHKVYPITSGNRYSLTVWAKGPLWV